MATVIENECVGCLPEMGCIGSACKYRNSAHLECDRCGDYADELYVVDGEEVCEDCLRDMFEKVTL